MSRVELLGLAIDNLTLDGAVRAILARVETTGFAYAVTPNVDHVMRVRRSPELRRLYDEADFVLADGVPLVWASRLLGTPLRGRVNGTDLFERLCAEAAALGYPVYLLGGNPGVAAHAGRVLAERHPSLLIAGTSCPSATDLETPETGTRLRARIRESGARLLFVGLGSPKQERWIVEHAQQAGVSFAVGIGVSFSLVAGEIARAPVWMQRSGLEWLWRLAAEPRRLWRRYLLDDAPFVWTVGMAVASRPFRAARRVWRS